jgi:hypothetical protein
MMANTPKTKTAATITPISLSLRAACQRGGWLAPTGLAAC